MSQLPTPPTLSPELEAQVEAYARLYFAQTLAHLSFQVAASEPAFRAQAREDERAWRQMEANLPRIEYVLDKIVVQDLAMQRVYSWVAAAAPKGA